MLQALTKVLCIFVLLIQVVHAQEQWIEVNNGLSDLKVLTLAIDAEDRLFAGTDAGKIFRSVDSGANWVDVTHNINLYMITKLVASPDGTLYIANDYPSDNNPIGIIRSTDHGETWTPYDEGLPDPICMIRCLEISPEGIPYLGVTGLNWVGTGIYRLNGETNIWELFNTYPGNEAISIEFDGPDVIYLGEGLLLYGGHCVQVSKDGGKTFHRLGNFPLYAEGVYVMHVDEDGYFYAACPQPCRLDWDWVPLNGTLPDENTAAVAMVSRPFPFGDMYMATYRHGVFRTVRHGAIWEDVNRGLTNLNATELVCDSDGTLYVATDGGGVFRSNNSVPVTLSEFLVE